MVTGGVGLGGRDVFHYSRGENRLAVDLMVG